MNNGVLVSVHGYAGDQQQVHDLLPAFEHHQRPVLIVSPEDSPITKVGPHTCIHAGKRAYIGQDSWDRQYLQMKKLLEYPFDFYFLNDSDSFCLTPELPPYLFTPGDTVYSNQVTDFRAPGQTWTDSSGSVTWPDDYHKGYPLIAMQPPYFIPRDCLERIVKVGKRPACITTPFIDWYMVEVCVDAGVKHLPFQTGASCETVTPNGIETMKNCIARKGATFIHSVKTKEVFDDLRLLHQQLLR